jgi:extradiol dioxygenase family protein
MSPIPFHLAFPVRDLGEARAFYVGVLECGEGRSSDRWIDFDFHGHQIVAHLCPEDAGGGSTNDVDGKAVPVRHFGAVLDWDAFFAIEARLREAAVTFLIEPHTRFEGEPGEQATMFLSDPSGNAIEFKTFRDPSALFRK